MKKKPHLWGILPKVSKNKIILQNTEEIVLKETWDKYKFPNYFLNYLILERKLLVNLMTITHKFFVCLFVKTMCSKLVCNLKKCIGLKTVVIILSYIFIP